MHSPYKTHKTGYLLFLLIFVHLQANAFAQDMKPCVLFNSENQDGFSSPFFMNTPILYDQSLDPNDPNNQTSEPELGLVTLPVNTPCLLISILCFLYGIYKRIQIIKKRKKIAVENKEREYDHLNFGHRNIIDKIAAKEYGQWQ